MSNVKTSELNGNALCYAVTMIEMPHLVWGQTIGLHYASNQVVVLELPEPQCYSPFTGRDTLDLLVEREMLSVYPFFCDGELAGWTACNPSQGEYDEIGDLIEGSDFAQDGPTPLIAAMRCLVASKMGDNIEIPDELLNK
jgi:hypothetical protein